MTFKELLNLVTFDEVANELARYCPDEMNGLACYKTRFDKLHMMEPKHHNDDNNNVCYITKNRPLYDTGFHIAAKEKLDDLWEYSLAKVFVLAPDVKATDAELAACCLWYSSSYCPTNERQRALFESWVHEIFEEPFGKRDALEWIKKIDEAGGKVPTIEELLKISSYRKDVQDHWTKIDTEYWCRIGTVGAFIVKNLPEETDVVSLPVEDLCQLFYSTQYIEYNYKSVCDDEKKRAAYLKELIDKYHAFGYGTYSNAVIAISSSKAFPLTSEDTRLTADITSMCAGKCSYIHKVDDSLGRELIINIVFYEFEKDK
ncbi:MAG: hypothetical protein K6F89_00350 [Prevotella sp.]|nr:hypothetical protein [Prevotella sp.]